MGCLTILHGRNRQRLQRSLLPRVHACVLAGVLALASFGLSKLMTSWQFYFEPWAAAVGLGLHTSKHGDLATPLPKSFTGRFAHFSRSA